jgi:hypothetical protein
MLTAEQTDLHQAPPLDPADVHPCAVTWIDDHAAVVAVLDANGRVSTCTITRGTHPAESFLSLVVRAIGERERVVILGQGWARLALEREYVAIYKRPEHLVDVERSDSVLEIDLIRRLRELAG